MYLKKTILRIKENIEVFNRTRLKDGAASPHGTGENLREILKRRNAPPK